ncbi:hypothetical protein L0F63_004132 [Massospora cicadina]|nr:hypothetical protein L0F63_004132 [Massospora cicadina]
MSSPTDNVTDGLAEISAEPVMEVNSLSGVDGTYVPNRILEDSLVSLPEEVSGSVEIPGGEPSITTAKSVEASKGREPDTLLPTDGLLDGFSFSGRFVGDSGEVFQNSSLLNSVEDDLEKILMGRVKGRQRFQFQTAAGASMVGDTGLRANEASSDGLKPEDLKPFNPPEKRAWTHLKGAEISKGRCEGFNESGSLQDPKLYTKANHTHSPSQSRILRHSTSSLSDIENSKAFEGMAQRTKRQKLDSSTILNIDTHHFAPVEDSIVSNAGFLKPIGVPRDMPTKPASVVSVSRGHPQPNQFCAPFKRLMGGKPVTSETCSSTTNVTRAKTSNSNRNGGQSILGLGDRPTKCLLTSLQEMCGHLPGKSGLALATITLETASQYRFDNSGWGLKEAKAEMLAKGADATWTSNHYAQIVWKLACLVRNYSVCQSRWNVAQVRKQLTHRFQTETQMGRSSVIKAIVEQSLAPHHYFVAAVSRVAQGSLFITDGWYEIECAIDAPLRRALTARRIYVGQKLSISSVTWTDARSGEPASGGRAGTSNWEPAQLPFTPCAPSNLHLDGGRIPIIEANVVRKYPLKFLTKTAEGNFVRTYEEELAFRESNPLSDSEGGEREAYQSLEEGKRYQFFSLAPGSSQKEAATVELVSCNATTWKPSPNQPSLPCRQPVLVAHLASLPTTIEVDVVVGYLGAALNGVVFVDTSARLLVVRPPPAQKDAFGKLKVGCVVGLENFKVGSYFEKFGIQSLDFGYNSIVRSGAAFESQHAALRSYLDDHQPAIDKLLEDAVDHTQSGIPPSSTAGAMEASGKFTEWRWVGNRVHATFETLDGVRHRVVLSPSQWKHALALTLCGGSLDRFKNNLVQGNFIDPTLFAAKDRSQYLKLHCSVSRFNAYRLVSEILARRTLSAPLHAVWMREVHNLMVYFSKRSCLYRFKISFDPNPPSVDGCRVVQIYSLETYSETPLPSQASAS